MEVVKITPANAATASPDVWPPTSAQLSSVLPAGEPFAAQLAKRDATNRLAYMLGRLPLAALVGNE